MKHLIWGALSMTLGAFFLLTALFLANMPVGTNLIYGGIFVVYGIYRLNKYRRARSQNAYENGNQTSTEA